MNGWLGRPEPRYGNQAQGCAGTGIAARPRCRKPHPEVYLEAFANIYRDFADLLRGESAPLLHGIEGALITHFGTVLPCSSRMAAVDPDPVVHEGKDKRQIFLMAAAACKACCRGVQTIDVEPLTFRACALTTDLSIPFNAVRKWAIDTRSALIFIMRC